MLNENIEQYNNYDKWQRGIHSQLDEWYKQKGWEILTRKGDIHRDLEVKIDNENKKLQEKIIQNVWDKISIEIVQDLLTLNPGWAHYCDANLLVWAMCESNVLRKVLVYNWHDCLQQWWKENAIKYGLSSLRVEPRGKGWTLNQLIPFSDIEQFLYKEPKKIVCPKCKSENVKWTNDSDSGKWWKWY